MAPVTGPAGPAGPAGLVRAEGAARTSYGRILALLASASGDVHLAEDALADAFERALRSWGDGPPDNPDAWLLTAARNRMRDHWRSAEASRTTPLEPERDAYPVEDDIDPDAIPDRRLELLLVCAHPAIAGSDRTPLMLNTVLGYPAASIGRALAVPARTMATRLVRAKRRIKANRIPFRVPEQSVLGERLPAVLEAVYGAVAIDWRALGTTDAGAEALGLSDVLAALLPDEPEVRGLAALAAFVAARRDARVDESGGLVALHEQDPAAWNRQLIERGRAHLVAAHARGAVGRYQLEAAIQATHCAREAGTEPDWSTLRALYDALVQAAPTAGAQIARAAVIAQTDGPRAGLAALDLLGDQQRWPQPAWAVRADLLRRLGNRDSARAAYDRAIELSDDEAEQRFLAGQRP